MHITPRKYELFYKVGPDRPTLISTVPAGAQQASSALELEDAVVFGDVADVDWELQLRGGGVARERRGGRAAGREGAGLPLHEGEHRQEGKGGGHLVEDAPHVVRAIRQQLPAHMPLCMNSMHVYVHAHRHSVPG